jgi:ABC-type phosphate/phosphonate transport system substrate-binding protein
MDGGPRGEALHVKELNVTRTGRTAAACGLLFLCVNLLPELAVGGGTDDAIQIGLPRTLFRDIPDSMLTTAAGPFKNLMKAQVGMAGNINHLPDAMTVAAQLDGGQMHLGVFQGFEFAWVKAKYPSLEPLVVCVPRYSDIRACLVVRADSKARTLADLKDGKLAIPLGTRGHVVLFLDKLRAAEACGENICQITKPAYSEDALDDVVDGGIEAALVDAAAFANFQSNKPGRSQRLRLLAQSDPFPPAVIAYKRGGIDAVTLQKCQTGLINAEKNQQAVVVLRMMKLRGFETVPANYDQLLKKSAESYPAPDLQPASFHK